ncbi:hypothetical protein HY386_00525 [Candidatus Daviesbacteria bacterium]|nr:hypothetical protein [Candidatus Daviesbacteria bacterium]
MFKLKKIHLILLALILLIALFFRTFQIVERFEFAHDGDLYSWIVKDMVVDGHFRLIGQLTTAPGVFIGPFFYYLLIPFFLLTKMDPIGGLIPITFLGLLTVFSYYFCFSRLFSKQVGLIAAFLHAVLLSPVIFDRAVVPSTPTHLWMIWYFYTVISLVRGNFKVLPILGVLIGLIWHIHVALFPPLLAVPVALILAKKLPPKDEILKFIILLLVTSLPLLGFEIKHYFSQTVSLIHNLSINQGGGQGVEKLNLILIYLGRNISRLFLYPQMLPEITWRAWFFIILLPLIFFVQRKILATKEVLVLLLWMGGVIGFYSLSSTVISEYYFTNLEVIFMMIVSLSLVKLINLGKWWKVAIFALLGILLLKNLYFFITQPIYKKGYLERKAVAEFITRDSQKRGFPCVAVSYITPPGENVGFRYMFWLNRLHVNQPFSGSPVYTIVFPADLARGAIDEQYGQIGVILPENVPSVEKIKFSCSGANSNLTDPLFGFPK